MKTRFERNKRAGRGNAGRREDVLNTETTAVAERPLESGELLLEVDNLKTQFNTKRGVLTAVDRLSFKLHRGEVLGLVGESGCGKSVASLSILRLIHQRNGRIVDGAVRYLGRDLIKISEREMRLIRGKEIAMIFQEPMTALNPVLTIGQQIIEQLTFHQGLSKRAARNRATEMLDLVRIPDPRKRIDAYPHEMSGGMRQRAMVAMALSCNPKVLIADEPTTALDVTIQAQILDLLRELQEALGTAIIMITHDLGVIAEMAHRVVVMYAGRKVEEGQVGPLFEDARHPYTRGLLRAVPLLDSYGAVNSGGRLHTISGTVPALHQLPAGCAFAPRCPNAIEICHRERPQLEEKRADHFAACWNDGACATRDVAPPAAPTQPRTQADGSRAPAGVPVLKIDGLKKHYPIGNGFLSGPRGYIYAVDGVSFQLAPGETLSLVGESGCGKSTVGRSILKLIDPTAGRIHLEGVDIAALTRHQMQPYRRRLQIIFQDPFSSLNPRATVGEIVGEPLTVHGIAKGREKDDRVEALFHRVGLRSDQIRLYPHEFSGGQRQRIGIARALAVEPKVIVADEPVSALDVSIQAQVVNLLMDLQAEFGLSYLFIAHDLSIVGHISHRVAVMYLGRIVELADCRALFSAPQHPYTQALLSAVPVPDPKHSTAGRIVLKGDVPSPAAPPAGCPFHTRCPVAVPACRSEVPALREVRPRHFTACHLR
jgi:peptide/nickel transport system ATP-binding protein